jgi:hypothetical protein
MPDIFESSGLPMNRFAVAVADGGSIVVLAPMRQRFERGDVLNLVTWLIVLANLDEATVATAAAVARNT